MPTNRIVALFVAFGSFVVGCGGEVSTTEQSVDRQAAARANCPGIAPESAHACPEDGLRCEYPVVSCALSYACTCSANGGWTCTMPRECVHR